MTVNKASDLIQLPIEEIKEKVSQILTVLIDHGKKLIYSNGDRIKL